MQQSFQVWRYFELQSLRVSCLSPSHAVKRWPDGSEVKGQRLPWTRTVEDCGCFSSLRVFILQGFLLNVLWVFSLIHVFSLRKVFCVDRGFSLEYGWPHTHKSMCTPAQFYLYFGHSLLYMVLFLCEWFHSRLVVSVTCVRLY